MKKQRATKKLVFQPERIRELVLAKERPVLGGLVVQSGFSFCYCSEGGGGSTE